MTALNIEYIILCVLTFVIIGLAWTIEIMKHKNKRIAIALNRILSPTIIVAIVLILVFGIQSIATKFQ